MTIRMLAVCLMVLAPWMAWALPSEDNKTFEFPKYLKEKPLDNKWYASDRNEEPDTDLLYKRAEQKMEQYKKRLGDLREDIKKDDPDIERKQREIKRLVTQKKAAERSLKILKSASPALAAQARVDFEKRVGVFEDNFQKTAPDYVGKDVAEHWAHTDRAEDRQYEIEQLKQSLSNVKGDARKEYEKIAAELEKTANDTEGKVKSIDPTQKSDTAEETKKQIDADIKNFDERYAQIIKELRQRKEENRNVKESSGQR